MKVNIQKLEDKIETYDSITIQCHDNPDADTIASGYGLYTYFSSRNKKVRLIYSGRFFIHKPNLKLMIEELQIPIEYVEKETKKIDGLLITVDCQYGAGNVTRFEADEVVIVDHHQIEIKDVELSYIFSSLGSCSTIIWSYLKVHEFPVNENENLATALYYGLYSDTNQFTEIYNPLDLDMREELVINKSKIMLFRNSNLTLKELEIAGIALLRCIHNDDYKYAIVKAQPCDPNILGLISDFLLQVDGVHTCVVYNTLPDGYKISVRSCIKEVKASELAQFLTEEIGSGGGHFEKAGGFISNRLYEEKYPTLHTEAYFSERMNAYFDSFDIIYADQYELSITSMDKYRKKKVASGYARTMDMGARGDLLTIRTENGDMDVIVDRDTYVMLDMKGMVNTITKKDFLRKYVPENTPFHMDTDYKPTMRNHKDNKAKRMIPLFRNCYDKKDVIVYGKTLEKPVKIFTREDQQNYHTGQLGDYLLVGFDEKKKQIDKNDIDVMGKELFVTLFDRCDN